MKQDSIAIDKKTTVDLKTASERMTVAGTVVTIGTASAIGICLYLFWLHPLSPFAQTLIFFLAGLVHVFTIRKSKHTIASTGEWVYTLLAACLILALLGSSSFWGPQLPLFLILASACAFLLPYTATEMWRAYLQLALDGTKVWYPTTEMQSNYPTFYFNSTPIRFRVLQGNGKRQVNIHFKVSNEMPLGKVYYDLVQNKARKTGKLIAMADAEQNNFHWVFFTTEGFLFARPLDPEKTLLQNGLHEDKVVYVQRISPNEISTLHEQ